eukprot:6195774-Pleurochrysis_carterae.AAC.2
MTAVSHLQRAAISNPLAKQVDCNLLTSSACIGDQACEIRLKTAKRCMGSGLRAIEIFRGPR